MPSRPLFQVIDKTLVDKDTKDEEMWYTVYTNTKTIWDWLRDQSKSDWYNHPGESLVDVSEKLFLIMCLKFGE